MPVWIVSQRFSHFQWRSFFKELWSRPTTIADFGFPLWEVPYTSNLCLLEDKVQDRGVYLFTISYGSYAVDQGSGGGWFSGWIKIFVLHSYLNAKFLKYLMRGLHQPWTRSSIIPISKGKSVWRNKKPKKLTVSFEEDRLPTWSTNNSVSLEPIVLSKTTPTCSPLFFEMTIFRNSILSGTEYYCPWRKSHIMTSWKDCTNWEYESPRNSRPYWNCMTWRFIRRS